MQIRNKLLTGDKFASYFNTEESKQNTYQLWINGVPLNYPYF